MKWQAGLIAESGTDGHALAARRAAAAQNGRAALGLHARPESMCLHARAAVGLKCALGHVRAPLLQSACSLSHFEVYPRDAFRIQSRGRSGCKAGRVALSRRVLLGGFAQYGNMILFVDVIIRVFVTSGNLADACILYALFIEPFTIHGATFSRPGKFCEREIASMPQLCYYRDRSEKSF